MGEILVGFPVYSCVLPFWRPLLSLQPGVSVTKCTTWALAVVDYEEQESRSSILQRPGKRSGGQTNTASMAYPDAALPYTLLFQKWLWKYTWDSCCFVFSTGTPQAMLHWALPRVDQMERSQPLVPVEAKVQTWICRAVSPAARGLGWLQAERSPCSPQALFPWDSLGIALPSPRSHPWACWRPALQESSCAWSHCRDKILHPGSAAAT